MRLYLLDDLKKQRQLVLKRLRQFVVFLVLLFLLDRAAGVLLLHGLEKYYGLADPAEVLLVGYSHLVLGVDKVLLEKELGAPVAKYARAGATLRDREVMVEHYLSRNPESVRVVVYGVDAHLFTPQGLSSNSYTLFYPYMDDPVVASFLRDADPPAGEYYLRKLLHTARYNDVTLGLAIRGYRHDWRNHKQGRVNIARLNQEIKEGRFRRIGFDERQLDIFQRTIQNLRQQNIKVVLAYIPTLDLLNAAQPEKYTRAIAIFDAVAAGDSGVYFVNFNPAYADRHELFRDPVHMRAEGQELITRELLDTLRRLLPEAN